MPRMTPLESTNIAAVGFDDESDYPVLVEFRSGATYAYPGTREDVEAMVNDPSAAKGHYFDRNIKPRAYRRIS